MTSTTYTFPSTIEIETYFNKELKAQSCSYPYLTDVYGLNQTVIKVAIEKLAGKTVSQQEISAAFISQRSDAFFKTVKQRTNDSLAEDFAIKVLEQLGNDKKNNNEKAKPINKKLYQK